MEVRYTRHAQVRMGQRRVSEAVVIETLISPDEVMAGDDDELIAVRRFGDREVRVVYMEVDRNVVVVFTVIKARSRR